MKEPVETKVIAGFALQQRLGSGSFATVYRGVRIKNQDGQQQQQEGPDQVAIKAITRTSEKLTKKVLENLEMEISILRTYKHPNIVCLQQVHKTQNYFYLILEYCGGGDLQRLIRTRKSGRLSERLTRRLMRDLASGLKFLWGQELIHRDIKPQNLLLTGPLPLDEVNDPAKMEVHEEMRIKANFPSSLFSLKIADFGFARHLQQASLAETLCGSPLYMAPEILQHHRYDAKADLWSVGTVLFEMIVGQPPFNGENHIDLLRNIQRKAVRLPPDVRVSKECVNLLRILLNRNPLSRAGFREFVEACDAFVALGCEGVTAETPEDVSQIPIKMDLGTIHEADDAHGAASMVTVATTAPQAAAPVPIPAPPRISPPAIMQSVTPPTGTTGFVTPPFGPMASPPATLHSPPFERRSSNPLAQTPSQQIQQQPRFAPLQPSPPQIMSTQYAAGRPASALPYLQTTTSSGGVTHALQSAQSTTSPPSGQTSQHSSDEGSGGSGFVMVEHGAAQRSSIHSPAGSGTINVHDGSPTRYLKPSTPSNLLTRGDYMVVNDTRSTRQVPKGMLSTSPGTGLALVDMGGRARLLRHSSSSSGTLTPTSRGVDSQIQSAVKMVQTAEDVGRRAISVAHLGDIRAYVAMRRFVGSGVGSVLLASSPMIGVEEEDDDHSSASVTDCETSQSTDVAGRRRSVSISDRSMTDAKVEDDHEEMPFAVTEDTPKKKNPAVAIPTRSDSASTTLFRRNSLTQSKASAKASPEAIRSNFSEALSCYLKALSMLKSVLSATQKVKHDIEMFSSNSLTQEQRGSIQALLKRCDVTSSWLSGQFTGVLERADAANVEISKLPAPTATNAVPVTTVEELIYNHSLACGRDGAVKQLLGQHEAARSCYRSAGLLAETLLMEPNVGAEDRKVLEGYVDGFAARITELDASMLQQSRSIASSSGSSIAASRRGSGVIGVIGGLPPPAAGFDAVSTAYRFNASNAGT